MFYKFIFYNLIFFTFQTLILGMDVLIVTEGNNDTFPRICAENIRRLPPFDELSLSFKYVSVEEGFAECSYPTYGRGMACNPKISSELLAENGGDRVIYFARSNYGADTAFSKYNIAFISLTQGAPCLAVEHEFMHLLGFADEYSFRSDLKEWKCRRSIKSHNMSTLSFADKTFSSDQQARDYINFTRLSSEIPWYKDIKPTTPITHPIYNNLDQITHYKLGTPSDFYDQIGLFQGNCDNRFKPIIVYNIMTSSRRQFIPAYYQEIIKKVFALHED